jgi:hypothetical protein
MRTSTLVLRIALPLVFLPAMSLVWGCGGGSSGQDNGPTDSGGPELDGGTRMMESGLPPKDASVDATSMPDGSTSSVTVVAPDVSVYVSQLATLDASMTQGPSMGSSVSFTWSVTKVPAGSLVTSQSLQGATTGKPSFTPDVVGDYVVTVTATSGGAMATHGVTVHAANGYVFYLTTKADDVAPYLEYDVVQMDGTGPHAIACRQHTFVTPPAPNTEAGVVDFSDGGAESGVGEEFLGVAAETADYSLDSWEGPAGTPARGAFSGVDVNPDGAAPSSHLLAATSDSTCQNPPAQVHVINGNAPQVQQPRFSPDGSRIAYIEQRSQGDVHIATVGFDGTDYHDFGNMCGGDAGGTCAPGNYSLTPARPQWIDATHVAWLVDNGSGNFVIFSAPDTNNTTLATYMTCQGQFSPRGFAILKDGSVLANYQGVGSQVEDLVVFGKNAMGICMLQRNLTKLANAYSYARDFSVSPDGTMVAFIQRTTAPNEYDSGAGTRVGGGLYLVPVDGSTPPHAVGGASELYAYFGPRWIAGGTHLAWNGAVAVTTDASTPLADAGLFSDAGLPAMNVIPVGGGPLVHVAQSDPANEIYVLGGGNGGGCSFQLCSASPGKQAFGAGKGVGLGGLIGFAFLLRRRGRKTS